MARQRYDDTYEPRPTDLLEIAKTVAGHDGARCADCAALPDGWPCSDCYTNGRADVTAAGYE